MFDCFAAFAVSLTRFSALAFFAKGVLVVAFEFGYLGWVGLSLDLGLSADRKCVLSRLSFFVGLLPGLGLRVFFALSNVSGFGMIDCKTILFGILALVAVCFDNVQGYKKDEKRTRTS